MKADSSRLSNVLIVGLPRQDHAFEIDEMRMAMEIVGGRRQLMLGVWATGVDVYIAWFPRGLRYGSTNGKASRSYDATSCFKPAKDCVRLIRHLLTNRVVFSSQIAADASRCHRICADWAGRD